MTDLLTQLQPNAEDLQRPAGTLRGDVAALDAAARNVEVWCGVTLGWRPFGAPIGDGGPIVVQWGRAWAGRSWDLGEAKFPRRADEESGA